MSVDSGCPAKTRTSSMNVPDGQSGPVAVNVLKPVAKLTCSVIVNGTGAAACADAAAPSGATTASASAASLMMRRIVTPRRNGDELKGPVGEAGSARKPTIRPHDLGCKSRQLQRCGVGRNDNRGAAPFARVASVAQARHEVTAPDEAGV